MRQLTSQQTTTLSSPIGYSTYARVKVERSSTWYDLTAFLGRDFLEEVTVSENTDAQLATAQVRLLREVNGASLAPLMTSAASNIVSNVYNPLLKEGRRFTVEWAVEPLGMAPTTWIEAFRGRIDEIDVGEDGITFSGRDEYGGTLQDTSIETEHEYGSTLGVAVETVLQFILNDNGLSAITLYTPVSPGWVLGKYVQKGEPVADAFTALTRQLGWEWRQKWLSGGPGTGAWRLWFWSPDRSAAVPAWTFSPTEYRNLSEVRTSWEDVRNAVEVVYSDKADLDAAGNPKRKTVSDSDAASIAAYGRRFMRMAEAATSNINTASEAAALAARAKADLKDVPLGVAFEVLLHPGLELGDLVKLTGNEVHFSAAQTAAVLSLSHTVNAYGGTTKVVLRGRPSTSIRTWLDMEQRPSLAPASPFTGPEAPSNLSTATTVQGFRLRFDPPTVGPAAAEYELHVSTINGFTPSSSTRRDTARATEFAVTDLEPGTTYYARVVPRDVKGNRGTASAQVTFSPRYVEPRILQERINFANSPPNGDWEALNGVNGEPDKWVIAAGTWGLGVDSTSNAYTGGSALVFPYVGPADSFIVMRSEFFIARPGETYALEAYVKSASGGALGFGLLSLRWYDGTFTDLGTGFIGAPLQVTTAGTWQPVKGTTVAPATARYARVELQVDETPRTVDVYLDAVLVEKRTGVEEAGSGVVYANSWTDYTDNGRSGAHYWKDSVGVVHLEGMIKSGTVGAVAFNLPAPYRPPFTRDFAVATAAGAGHIEVGANGDVRVSNGSAEWTSLNAISFKV